MDVQLGFLKKKNGINKLVSYFFASVLSDVAMAGIPVFDIVIIDSKLIAPSFPVQNAQANSSFNYNLATYLNVIQQEVDYRVTNNAHRAFSAMAVINLPQGVTRVYEGEGVCAERFSLASNQSCILRLIIDKNSYSYTGAAGPIVCSGLPAVVCYHPSPGAQIHDAITRSAAPTYAYVTPAVQDGLWYDPASLSIIGTPTRTGVYVFSVSASNGQTATPPHALYVDVNINPKDKPVFKTHYNIASALPEQNYRLNLMELIEPTAGFMINNQVTFSIDPNKERPTWLSLDPGSATILQGHVPREEAGTQKTVTITATSNTGGESLPLTISIPVIYDPAKKPFVDTSIKLFGKAGALFQFDLGSYVSTSSEDNSLKIVLDKIEPAAPWLNVASHNFTELNGIIPEDAVGTEYMITMHVSSAIGGNSDTVTIPLDIAIDKELTPYFYAVKPHLPLVFEGHAYFHDFVANHDVYPDNSDIPYQVELAAGYNNPFWLRIEDNKLVVDKVPDNLNQIEPLFITIKNLPGGKSEVIELQLFVMN